MHTFAQKSKPVQDSNPPVLLKPRLPFSGKSNPAVQRSSQARAEESATGSASAASTRFAHDFSQVPLSSNTRSDDVQQLARQGTSGSGSSLPYLDRIQQSFGPAHDLGHVKAHMGSAATDSARRMGAEAYATGSSVAFGTTPSLHTAAHEAAHVVQQQSGVQLLGGVGEAGDVYERNADAVADRVVRGETAADLLPAPQGSGGPAQASATQQKPVQMYTNVPAGAVYDKISDDGKMAVLNHGRKGWAESSNISNSNKILDVNKSKAKIEEVSGGDISVAPPGAAAGAAKTTLKQFRMMDRASGTEVELTDDCGTACQQSLGSEAAGYEAFVGVTKRGTTEEYTKPSKYEADDNAAGGLVSTTERMSGEIYIRIFEREFSKTLTREDALKEWDKLPADKKKELSKKYGINQFAAPKVGQGITIGSERDMPGASQTGYNFHFGLNLIASGPDYITLEDYASSGVKYYFDMYGPETKSQAWAQAPGNTGALDDKTTTMVVQHPESLNGIVNSNGVHFEDDPAAATGKKLLDKDTKVTIIRKGQSWMKVEVKSGARTGQSGWILNQFYTDN
jgi:hypothetical protein